MAESGHIQSNKKDVDFNIFVVMCVIISWVLILLNRAEFSSVSEVLGTNHHRGGQAVLDNFGVMMADSDPEALEILHKRGIDLILLCPQKVKPVIAERSKVTSIFFQRLCDDQVPSWLNKIQLPHELSEKFLLFETNFKSLEDQNN